jgi:enamine deaminase RidA (YjgF/YER057c/UK114 family)
MVMQRNGTGDRIMARRWIRTGIASALLLLVFLSYGAGSAFAQTATRPEQVLKDKNIVLPVPGTPTANFVGAVRTGNLLFVSGHTAGPQWSGKGQLGKEVTVEQGYDAARQAGINLLGTVRASLGSLDHVKRVVRVFGMVNSAPGFGDQPKVMNGFSDLMVEVFGDAGKHARSAVGMAGLPGNSPIEVEAVFEVE